jgi:predicted enzyme related to lactoylglutathione lyase
MSISGVSSPMFDRLPNIHDMKKEIRMADYNPVGWFEIYVSDMARARRFYEQVIGRPLQKLPAPGMEMWAFPWTERIPGAAGALVKMDGVPSGGNSTLVYFSCVDCAVEEARVVPAGGRVFKSKTPIGEWGFIALVFDTEGNMIGLHSRK